MIIYLNESKVKTNNQHAFLRFPSFCLGIVTYFLMKWTTTFFAKAGVGFLAELTEQNHETSHGAGGDMCEGTAASARPWLARGRMFARGQKRSKKHGQKPFKKNTDGKTLYKKHGQKTLSRKIEVFLSRNRD